MHDHIVSPEPGRSPYAHMIDADLLAAYERVEIDPDNAETAVMLAERERRGLVE